MLLKRKISLMKYEQKQKDFDWLVDQIEKYQDKLPEEQLKKLLETRDELINYLFNKKTKALKDIGYLG